jgi:hypothetical protein
MKLNPIKNLIFTFNSLTASRRLLFVGISLGICIITFPLALAFSLWWLLPNCFVLLFWYVLASWYDKAIKKIEKEQQESLKQIQEKSDPNEITLKMSQKEYETLQKEGSVVLEGKYPISLKNVNFIRGK